MEIYFATHSYICEKYEDLIKLNVDKRTRISVSETKFQNNELKDLINISLHEIKNINGINDLLNCNLQGVYTVTASVKEFYEQNENKITFFFFFF